MSILDDLRLPALVLAVAAGSVSIGPPAQAAAPVPYSAFPDCQDSAGNHLNYTSSTLAFACGTSAAPVVLQLQHEAIWQADSNTVVQNGTATILTMGTISGVGRPWSQVTIEGVQAATGGSGTPSFTAELLINGTSITSCGAISVTATPSLTACTGANTMSANGVLTLVITNVSGTPENAYLTTFFSAPTN